MPVSRSLTIKQFAIVSTVTSVTAFLFIAIQLTFSIEQQRVNARQQLRHIGYAIEHSLTQSMLTKHFDQAQSILNKLEKMQVVDRADVMLPNGFIILRGKMTNTHSVPIWIKHIFKLPLQITLPLYRINAPSATPKKIGSLILQAKSSLFYKMMIKTISILLVTYLLMSLILSIALSWFMNRLFVYPLRSITAELKNVTEKNDIPYQLPLWEKHKGDEFGYLIRSYNIQQHKLNKLFKSSASDKKINIS